VSRTQPKHAIAKIVLEKAEALQSDEWGERHAIRTDIVARPSKRRYEAIPTPDPDDPTTRMAPDRVMALLKAQQAFPEPLEPTPGSPTRVLDAAEVAQAQAQAEPPEPKRPFEVVESVPARPPRAPRIPSDFSTIPAEKTPAEKTPAALNHRESLRARVTRVGGLMLMALLVFALTFGITKALRDDNALSRARRAVIENYDRAAARVDAWFGARERAAPAATAPATAPKAAPPAPLEPEPEASEPAPPVVRLEDLKLLGSGSAKPAKQPPPSHR
jgi:hypothetical protein